MPGLQAFRGITVAVGDWYARTLAIALPAAMRHLSECVVITTADDHAVHAVVESTPGARLSITDAFTRHGARFNKGLAIEEAGFDALGRRGWIVVFDADVAFPPAMPWDRIRPDHLHGARRLILDDPADWHEGLDWSRCRRHFDGGPIGFFQAFHADAPALRGVRPWYDVSFAHAGGGDAYFLDHWPRSRRTVLPVDVLHLGPVDRHWFGTTPGAVDLMAAFVHRNGWRRAMRAHDPDAVARVGDAIPGRVVVPGYPPSTYELPFERRRRPPRAAPLRPGRARRVPGDQPPDGLGPARDAAPGEPLPGRDPA